MKLTEAEILRFCGDEDVFYKGRLYKENGRVKKLKTSKINSFEEYTEAKVSGTHNYNVSVWAEDGKVVQSVCDCPAFEKRGGICKHIAAVLLSFAKDGGSDKSEGGGYVTSSAETGRIIDNYKMQLGFSSVPLNTEKATLYPILKIENAAEYYIEFKIGFPKKYIIKDLCAFSADIKGERERLYGKNGLFLHKKEAFWEKSRPMVDFICRAAEENRFFNNAYNKYYYMAELKARELVLSPALLDDFFSAATEGETICVEYKFNSYEMTVKKKNPRLSFWFSKKGKDAVMVEVEDYLYLLGDKGLYIFKDNEVFVCTEDYKRKMGGIITGNMSCHSSGSFYIGNTDMKFFYNRIFPEISEYSNIFSEGDFLSQFSLPEPKLKFYIDCPKLSYITARCEVDYGEGAKNPFSFQRGGGYKDELVESLVEEILRRYFPVCDNGIFKIEDNDDLIFDFASRGIEELGQKGEVFVSEGFERIKIKEQPKISVGLSVKSDILNLEFSADDFDLRELKNLLKSYRKKIKYHRLKDGSFLRLDEDEGITKIAEAADALNLFENSGEESSFALPKYRALYLDKIFSNFSDSVRNREFKSLIRDIKSAADSDFEVPESLRGVLRSYQKYGFRWLKTMEKCGFGGILADDMGLGKTLQVITLLLYESENFETKDEDALSLVVCPASLIYNWEAEIKRFAPSLKCEVVAGNAEERAEKLRNMPKGAVIVTGYDLLRRDVDLYENLRFKYQIIDEAQYIKNSSTKVAEAVKKITASTRFALTGTPVENRLSELWSIFDYLMPGYLFSYARFKSELEAPALKEGDKDKMNRIKNMVAPFILRREKKSVLKELPEKVENVFMCSLEGEQRLAYAAEVKQLRDYIGKGGVREKGAIKILAMLTKLRQLCCDPGLCYENYGGGSSKLESAVTLIKRAIAGGHKILLFSQFTSMIEIIETRLKKEEIDFYTLTGATSKEERIRLVNNFQQNDVPVFLISLKAGGTGLNLTAADVVIHFDPWWNVAAQNQATDRTHRIGQKNVVTVYKLIAKDTVEEKILKLQNTKKNLADAVITGENVSISKLSEAELSDLFGLCE